MAHVQKQWAQRVGIGGSDLFQVRRGKGLTTARLAKVLSNPGGPVKHSSIAPEE